MCTETSLKYWGVPKYKSAKMAVVAATTSNKRKLDTQCAVAMPKQRGGLPRQAKAVAGPVRDAEDGPVLPKGYKALTQPQAKRAAKAIEGLTADSLALGELIGEVGKEGYTLFVPPYLLPQAKVAQGALELVSASLEVMMGDDWVGIFAGNLEEVKPARLAAKGFREKLQEIVDEHRPVDGHGVPLDAKGKAK